MYRLARIIFVHRIFVSCSRLSCHFVSLPENIYAGWVQAPTLVTRNVQTNRTPPSITHVMESKAGASEDLKAHTLSVRFSFSSSQREWFPHLQGKFPGPEDN